MRKLIGIKEIIFKFFVEAYYISNVSSSLARQDIELRQTQKCEPDKNVSDLNLNVYALIWIFVYTFAMVSLLVMFEIDQKTLYVALDPRWSWF